MGLLTLVSPIVGQPDKTEDVKIPNALAAIQSWANGGIDSVNLTDEGIEGKKLKKSTITTDKLTVGGVLELFSTGTERKIAWGGPIATPGSGRAGPNTRVTGSFAHGMGKTPVFASVIAAEQTASSNGSEEGAYIPSFGVTALGATEISYEGSIPGVQSSRSWKFYWVAIA
ncbi:MAG TPA: hypothetical protein VGY30_10800 [Solirubrobacteraceae bacterium]|jgi:hypothetical protein|nr:hypothetical protein [Solirubrobacteraceae bacterium]